ncbi:MAG: fatty acid desaturase [Ahniella sp.]|nr:fatty acid desaturase [Ahniella sp.]
MTSTETSSSDQRVARIQAVIRAEETQLRSRYPWLRHQDSIGLAILVFALSGMVASAWAGLTGWIPVWLSIPLVAVFASLTHELEHDLIHWMYFRRRPWVHHLMMALVWAARPSTINPWLRRHLHFHHHKHSGTESDIEERAITNGERWGLLRLLMTADAGVSVLARAVRAKAWRSRWRHIWRAALAYFPLGWIHWGAWWMFLAYHGANAAATLMGGVVSWPEWVISAQPALTALVVAWIGPNVLRSFCLHLVSSNMHYYGDIEPGNLLQQCQVLRGWWWWPAHLFCFNFGGTHAIHHFVVGQPFYLRQWLARPAQNVMREMGVRFDDLASLQRANRWRPTDAPLLGQASPR